MKIGIRVPPCRPATDVAAFAADVEAAGFGTLYVPDSQLLWRDSYLTLFAAALRTETLGLGTAVSNVVTRHPSVVASLTRTIAEVAPDRFFLGLGVGNSSVEPVGLAPSTRAELRQGIARIRGLLAGRPRRSSTGSSARRGSAPPGSSSSTSAPTTCRNVS